MVTFTTAAHRVLLAGGFAVAASAAPMVAALASSPAPAAQASCPSTEIMDPTSGACKPVTDQPAPTMNPIEPGAQSLQPGEITSGLPGNVGTLPEVNGIPCNGHNTGLCIGLEQDAGGATLPKVQAGVPG